MPTPNAAWFQSPQPQPNHKHPYTMRWAIGIGILLLFYGTGARPDPPPPADFKAWGFETLQTIETDFALPQGNFYADKMKPGQPAPNSPSCMWNCGVQLTALVAAAQLDKQTYLPLLRRHIKGMESYWQTAAPAPGYDVAPVPKPADRYYDDNLWVALALADAFEIAGDAAFLERAEATFAFALTGEDNKLDGGIYWRERKKTTKNTCSNGPAVTAALRLYQITRKDSYLETAKRLYAWTNAHLQDSDGLYFDNIRLDGTVVNKKWSYNTALMIRANVLFYAVTSDEKYLAEAQRLAKAAEAHWIKTETGGIADGAMFAHLLCEAFLAVYAEDHDRHWREIVERALVFVHEKDRDDSDHYGAQWDKILTKPLGEINLIHQASAARAFLVVAGLPEE